MRSRGELGVAAALVVATIASIAFIVVYFAAPDRLYEGLAIAVAAAALSLAAAGWAFWVLPFERVVDEIETYPSPPGERVAQGRVAVADLREVARPRFLIAMAAAAIGSFAAALIVPFRSLGPAPDDKLFHTRWRPGTALVREDGTPVRVDALNVDSSIAIFPNGAVDDAQSQATLIRLPPGVAGTAAGYIAYSRLCTHAGCPVALYRAAARELLCPCHQSVFDVVNEGAVLSGPADHALPRLPIAVGPDGVLRARGDFPEPVGPGFWERG
ncbi:MAG TPA: Rieske (2Fe-2S) protein [Candidatus Cybelea sp.]|jgi:ubiquinol-cytochrome c reductase iron-sulfur subunit|nr:Rieske (2Fe-2S) protein [Candidatus Cybelea sp.]